MMVAYPDGKRTHLGKDNWMDIDQVMEFLKGLKPIHPSELLTPKPDQVTPDYT